MPRSALFLALAAALALAIISCNPFAPRVEEVLQDRTQLLGNRRYISGLFQWFRNSYDLRDTTLYGQMLAPDFRFTYKDFSNGTLQFWDRDIDMRATWNLFRSVRTTNILWYDYIAPDTARADTLAFVERFYNLTVVQDEQNIFRSTGRARLTLIRKDTTQPWRIQEWFDRSDF